jgi:GTPase
VDAGKSTMLGVLVKGGLDDGRGKARVNLFRHKHEIESGRTSSVGMEIMGYDTHGDIVQSNVPGRKLSWEEIGNRSVCAFINSKTSPENFERICILWSPCHSSHL